MKTICATLLLVLSISTQAQDLPDKPQPKFFTVSHTVEMATAAGLLAVDGFQSNYIATHPYRYTEINPVLRGFGSRGTGAYFGLSYGAVLGGNYILRRHPMRRHIFNWAVIAVECGFVVHNGAS